MNKKKMIWISRAAHLVLALVLADAVQNLFARIMVLVSIGVLSGVQIYCIENTHPQKES